MLSFSDPPRPSGAPGLRQPCGLPPRLHKPAASIGLQHFGRALSCSAASRALAVSLRFSGSLHASPMAQPLSPLARCGAACGVSLRPSEPAASLGLSPRSAAISSGILFVIPVPACAGTGSGGNPGSLRVVPACHSRESGNPEKKQYIKATGWPRLSLRGK